MSISGGGITQGSIPGRRSRRSRHNGGIGRSRVSTTVRVEQTRKVGPPLLIYPSASESLSFADGNTSALYKCVSKENTRLLEIMINDAPVCLSTSTPMLRQGTFPHFITAASPFGGGLSSSGQRLEVCVPPWAYPCRQSTRFSASWIARMCLTLHTASEHSATNLFFC
jgi:hypothetical protein